MGQEAIHTATVSQSTQIIDFLYIDKKRTDSFIITATQRNSQECDKEHWHI